MNEIMVVLSGTVFLFFFCKIFFYVKDLLKQQGLEYKSNLTLQCTLYATMFGAFGTFTICASIYTIILLLSEEVHLG
jgi:hypothetical protein